MMTIWRKRVGFRFTAVVPLGLAIGLVASTAWGQSRCTSDKYKAAGKYAYALAKCHAKAIAGGIPLDPLCETKGLEKLQASFDRAETKGDCVVAGQYWTTAIATQDFAADLGSILESQVYCCAAGNVCMYAVDAAACQSQGGTLGAPGSVCDGATGTCTAPPAAGGGCCQNTPMWGTGCIGGQVDAFGCSFVGGTFIPGAVCDPSGACGAP